MLSSIKTRYGAGRLSILFETTPRAHAKMRLCLKAANLTDVAPPNEAAHSSDLTPPI